MMGFPELLRPRFYHDQIMFMHNLPTCTFCCVTAIEEIAERRVWGDPLKPGQSWNGKK